MSKRKKSFLLESSMIGRPVGRSLASFLTSFFLQGIAIAILIVVPLMATDAVPAPQGIMTFMNPPPVPPPPPQLPPPTRAQTVLHQSVTADVSEFLFPVEVPDDIGEGIDFFSVPGGIERDIPEDVLGGLINGRSNAPPPPPPKQEPVRVGGDIKAPRKINAAKPVYPEIARQARVQGVVILEAIIDPQGNVTNVRVLRSIALLDRAAMEAVRQWKYEPTLLNGMPVPIIMTVTVAFDLR
jgi:protein TonB